jgi:hypothetical protein
MTQKHKIQLFEEKKVRTVWDDEKEEWYFSIVDVCAVLTDSDYQTARKYWKVLKGRLIKEGNETVTNCYQLKFQAPDGKMRLTDVADTEQLFRIIQSIPSKKAEPNTNENENDNDNEKWRKRETFETIKFGRMRWSIAPRYISRLTRCLGLRRKAFATNFSVLRSASVAI